MSFTETVDTMGQITGIALLLYVFIAIPAGAAFALRYGVGGPKGPTKR